MRSKGDIGEVSCKEALNFLWFSTILWLFSSERTPPLQMLSSKQ